MNVEPSRPTQILPGLWIGDLFTAADRSFFERNKIGAVLNCTPDVPNHFENFGVEYMRIPVDDTLAEKDIKLMNLYLPHGVSFIFKNRDLDRKNVFVHCHAGIQRSVTMCVAYIHKKSGNPLRDVVRMVVSKRPVAYFGGKQINFKESLLLYCS